jgi:predicted MFS family arabinose efflux permease
VAFVDGWRISMWVCVGLAVAGLAVLIFRGPKAGELNVLDESELHNAELEELLASSGTLAPVS